ncbi:nucleotide sugar dehydrogenase [Kovacikia minuta CCNUW1]|uniref:nucleotide sugar dehydrogenase n=1 Tax=Kovacikia minuta TaxID=2931930 RepID=UPI001CCDCC5E|nr:nucleotide sugar dehydrogenase [Kovacikia minuta]UBF28452.1 nucleotide sugar dehydrogenase [Kovacikia minuta CCNUW1]
MSDGVSDVRFDICVVGGAGHVGLPLALVFASKGLRVLIYDINENTLETIRKGIVPFMERGAEPLLQQALERELLFLSSEPEDIARASTLIITIGTPVDEFLNPVLKLIRDCMQDLLPYLTCNQLIILRSTVYPGTTDWVDKFLRSHGKDIKLAFCPERVVQGYSIEELQRLPQIISGTTPKAEQEAAELFELIAPEVVRLSPMEAEFAKLFNNAYRYIQFAAANQFYMIANSAGVDYHRVLQGMKQNYPRARDIPAPGFAAGPCLFKDTMQLGAFSDNQFTLGHAAMLANEGLVLYLVDDIAKTYRLERLSVGLLGMAFKADSDDIRSSLSYKLKRVLEFRAKTVYTTDPYVKTDRELLPLDVVIARSDLLILCAPHSDYRHLDTKGKPVVDIWGFLNKESLVGVA